MPVERKPFSKILKDLRKEKKVTQEQLAQALGVSPQAVSKWENSSYPEGDLLPNIADFFGVSIDYLYGRSDRDKSIEEKVFEAVYDSAVKEFEETQRADEHYKTADLIRRIRWAMQTSLWVNNKTYKAPERDIKAHPKMASVVTDDVFYSYMGLREDNDFGVQINKPKDFDILEELVRDTSKMEALFKILSQRDNILVITYLYTLRDGELAGIDAIEKVTGVKEENIRTFLTDISELIEKSSKTPFVCASVIGANNKEEKVYGVNSSCGGLFFALLMIAREFIDLPQVFNMQINAKEKSWLNREKLFKK